MAVPASQVSIVGISSPPDDRPPFGAAAMTVGANNADPNRNHMTLSVAGRKMFISRQPAQYPHLKDTLLGP